ncbi:replication factor C subunit 4 [Hanseniaspora valbyensis]
MSSALPWIEKYRPQRLKDVVGNEEIISKLYKIKELGGNLPNMILSGTPGIGKTTSVYCLMNELLEPSIQKDAVLELNASDDRGIDVIRDQIKSFAQKKLTFSKDSIGKHKVVILDEADSMTVGAQQALRRTMEIYSNTTRFVFACNQSNKIIEPLQSRCSILKFNRLQDKDILKRLLYIIEQENVKYDNTGLEAIIFTADGDMRQAVNNLQSCWLGFQYVNDENVYKIVDSPHPLIITKILKTKGLNEQLDILNIELFDKGFNAIDVITIFFRIVKGFDLQEITEPMKLEILKLIGLYHLRILQGCNSNLQMFGLISEINKIMN